MINTREWRKYGATGSISYRKTHEERWEVEFIATAGGKDLEEVLAKMFKLVDDVTYENPGHATGCECLLCERWKEHDALERLGEKQKKR